MPPSFPRFPSPTWQHAARHRPVAAPPALAPPQWARAVLAQRARRVSMPAAMLLAATCSFAAIARAQVDTGGGGGDAGTAGGGTTGGGTTAAAPAASDAAAGSLRATVESVLPTAVNAPLAGPNREPAWTITPGISLLEEWTDNTRNTSTDRRSSLITVVQPSISINGSSARLTASLYYAPSLSLYTPDSSQNQFGQNLGADALLTLAPEQLYLRTTGYAAVQSLAGATAAPGTTALSRQNQIQTYSFSAQPYFTQRFGGWGTAQVGVSASETNSGAIDGGTTIQRLTTTQEYATLKSGENFGRMTGTLQVSSSQETGTGAFQGARRDVVSYQAGYAITRGIIALASIGWENIRYTGVGAPHYNDATWSVGTRLIPNADSTITVTYGHLNGATSVAVDASYAPTATVRLFATYSAGVSSAAETLRDSLANASFDALGHPVDATTGAPLTPVSNFYGFNGTIYQSKNLSVTASWLLPRDAFQATISHQTQTPVGNTSTLLASGGGVTFTQGLATTDGTTGTLSWQHDLSPVTSTNMAVQYGVLHNATPLVLSNGVLTATGQQGLDQTLFAVSAGVNWRMTRTLTSTLQYSYTSSDYANGLPGVASNLVVLGLRKTF